MLVLRIITHCVVLGSLLLLALAECFTKEKDKSDEEARHGKAGNEGNEAPSTWREVTATAQPSKGLQRSSQLARPKYVFK